MTAVSNLTPRDAQGVLPQDDIQVCAISLYLEHEPTGVFDDELAMAFSSFETGNLRVRGLTRGSGKELPRNMEGKQVLLLAPVVRKMHEFLERDRACTMFQSRHDLCQ